LLRWIAEGLQTDEINERGATFDPPICVSRAHVDYYRRTRKIEIEEIKATDEHKALNEGLALKSIRVAKLKKLAALCGADIFGDSLWVDRVKMIGSGNAQRVVNYEEFNKAECDVYRGLLDDIARELGGRVRKQEVDVTSGGEPIRVIGGVNLDEL